MAVKLPDYSPLARGKDELLDVVRGFSMFWVIVVHVMYAKVLFSYSPTHPDQVSGVSLFPVADSWFFDLVNWAIVWGLGFFVVGGALSRRVSGTKLRPYWRQRALRLLLPYYVFAAIMVPIELFLRYTQPDGLCGDFTLKKVVTWILPLHEDCLSLAQGPFWFLMTFIPIVLAAPLLLKVYDSRWRFPALVVGIGALALFDLGLVTDTTVLHFDQFIGTDNANPALWLLVMVHVFLFWSIQFYLGFMYADGYTVKLQRRKLLLPASLGLIGLAAVMVLSGVYPHNPWGWWKTTCDNLSCDGNQFPPTLAYMAASVGAYLLIVHLRRPVEAFGNLPVVNPALRWLSTRSLTIMIWHMVAYEIVWWGIRAIGWQPTVESWSQWLQRPMYFVLVVLVTILLVKIFYPIETVDWDDVLTKRLPALLRPSRSRPAPARSQSSEPAASTSRAQR